ncbi:MAG: hypothetical protein ACLKAN_10805 [Alkaliphilus sp.]
MTSKTDEEYNFIVYDTGVIEQKTVNAIEANCNEVILCATTKPYEIESYHRALDLIGCSKIHTLFSFTAEKIKEKLKKQYKDPLFAEYSPNLFDGEKNQNIWEQITRKYLTAF